MSTSLIDLWPSSANCLECLTTEAESASNAVFLAVHQPMSLSRRLFSSSEQDAEIVQEEDLLNAFLSDNLPSGTLLLPIVGSSGVGKSHMIRWLDAHVRARQDGVRRHIVRIPKSASLKAVLSLILADLTSDSDAYQTLHHELSSASMPKELDDATYGLLSKLVVALERNHKEATARIQNGSGKVDDRKRLTHCDPRCLPSLLGDPALKVHFAAHDGSNQLGVLARIASRYIQGDPAENGPQNVFTAEDFQFGGDVNLGEVSAPVRGYLNVLKQQNGQNLNDALFFLNEVVDKSLGELLDFRGSSLTDLFVRIREQLLIDDIELVLLVEDFAALAGIQFSLLDAVIREGVRDGKKVLCTMRTALAVTEGYLSSRDTVMTRAQYEWKISDFPFSNEDEAVDTYSNFAGGYLNASRWGKSEVEERYDHIKRHSSVDKWLPDYYQDVREELTEEDNGAIGAFGFSESGTALFPFNKGVIRQLVRSYFKKGEQFEFNPRRLINLVLRDTLVDHRRDFEAGVFPPAKFQDFDRNQAELSVLDEVKRKFLPHEKNRAEAFVYYWGDNPKTVGQAASIDQLLFQCFKLSVIDWSASPERREVKVTTPSKEGGVTPPNQTISPTDANIRNWKEKIDEWRRNGILKSGDANTVRGYLADSIGEYVDWNSLLLEKSLVDRTKIFLPNVSVGNPNDGDAIAFAGRNKDLEISESSDLFFRAMTAVVRYHEYKSWDYDGSEDDYVSYINLLDRMASDAKVYFLRRAHGLDRSAVSLIGQSLLIGSRILNVDGGSTNVDADNLASIYRVNASVSSNTTGKWEDLFSSASNVRLSLIEALKRHTVARQGDGSKALAVDASFLLRVIRENRKSWKLPSDLDTSLFRDAPQIREHVRTLKNTIDKSIEERSAYLSLWMNEVLEWLGDDFDMQQVQAEFLDLMSSTRKEQMFVCSSYQYEQLRALVRSLAECKTKENISRITTAIESSDFGQQLSAVSKVDDLTILTTRKVFGSYETFLTQTTAKVDERLATVPPSVDTIAEKCLNRFESIEAILNQLEGGHS
jgi:hypothetical protein